MFWVNFVSKNVIIEYLLMNLQLKFPNPKNLYNLIKFFDSDFFLTALIFTESILILFILIKNPRKLTSVLWNSHFSNLYLSFLSNSLLRTDLILFSNCSDSLSRLLYYLDVLWWKYPNVLRKYYQAMFNKSQRY